MGARLLCVLAPLAALAPTPGEDLNEVSPKASAVLSRVCPLGDAEAPDAHAGGSFLLGAIGQATFCAGALSFVPNTLHSIKRDFSHLSSPFHMLAVKIDQ